MQRRFVHSGFFSAASITTWNKIYKKWKALNKLPNNYQQREQRNQNILRKLHKSYVIDKNS